MWARAADDLAAQLAAGVPDEVERLYLVGAPGGTGHDAAVAYAMCELPAGYAHGAHVIDQRAPVYRVERQGRRPLWIMSADAWGTVPGATPELHAAAHAEVARIVRATFDQGAQVLATPAATGRELILRTLPAGREWPVLPMEVQDLIRSTSGQGRSEGWWNRDAGPVPPAQLDQLVELDQRLSYVALCRELPAGDPVRGVPRDLDLYARARYLVRFRVPPAWCHLGLLPVLRTDEHGRGSWSWPNEPGATGEGWCDGAELLIAHRQGWTFDVLDALVWPRYTHTGPLDRWATLVGRAVGLAAERADSGRTPARVAQLAGRYLRSIALHAIGTLHGRPRVETHVVPLDRADDVPDRVEFTRVERGQVIYGVRGRQSAPEVAHPEWSAAVWARARSRLLVNPAGGGALTLTPDQVVALRTDAIWSTTVPAWASQGGEVKPGAYRVKTVQVGPLDRPDNVTELLHRGQ